MGWLTDSIPNLGQARYMGQLEGENQVLQESLDKWIDYARKLEQKVKFYKSESQRGWAAYYAAKDIIMENTGKEPKEIPEFHEKMDHYLQMEKEGKTNQQ